MKTTTFQVVSVNADGSGNTLWTQEMDVTATSQAIAYAKHLTMGGAVKVKLWDTSKLDMVWGN